VTLVELPSDDMKGRIIGPGGTQTFGRSSTWTGRRLHHRRHAELRSCSSSFDGIRREIARMTLLKLIEDGRIHPTRIEEMYYLSKGRARRAHSTSRRAGGVRGELRRVSATSS